MRHTSDFVLEPIKGTDAQILTLYKLLADRVHNISHQTPPSFDDHVAFVRSKPYRKWYIVVVDSDPMGSVYVTKGNVIGLFLPEALDFMMSPVLSRVCAMHRPLKPIKSLRQTQFAVNIAPENHAMAAALREFGAKLIQHTYLL